MQWSVALTLDYIRRGFDSHSSPLTKKSRLEFNLFIPVWLHRALVPKALLGEFSNGCTYGMSVIEGYLSCNQVQLTGRDHLFSNSLASRAVATIDS